MNRRDAILLEIIQKEMETQRANLRTLDGSLHTLAFAYIASLSLCVPSLLTAQKTVGQIEAMFPLVGTVLCTIFFFGAFYALMLIRSRNVHLAHIAFLSDRINELIEKNYGEENKILFQQTQEISEFYYGPAKGKAWFFMYVVFLVIVAVLCICVLWASIMQGSIYGFVVLFEVVTMVGMYGFSLRKSGIRAIRARIEKDYEEWRESIS